MWNKNEYPASIVEAAAVHQVLFRLGYSLKDEIFLTLNEKTIGVTLRAEGKEGCIRIGTPEFPPEVMQRKWEEFNVVWNAGGTMTTDEKNEIYFSSFVYQNLYKTIAALLGNGFTRVNRSKAKLHERGFWN